MIKHQQKISQKNSAYIMRHIVDNFFNHFWKFEKTPQRECAMVNRGI